MNKFFKFVLFWYISVAFTLGFSLNYWKYSLEKGNSMRLTTVYYIIAWPAILGGEISKILADSNDCKQN